MMLTYFSCQTGDNRVGQGRDNSTQAGTVSGLNNKSSSLGKLGATFIPIAVALAVCLILFLGLRPRLKRVYAPRCIPALRFPEYVAPNSPFVVTRKLTCLGNRRLSCQRASSTGWCPFSKRQTPPFFTTAPSTASFTYDT